MPTHSDDPIDPKAEQAPDAEMTSGAEAGPDDPAVRELLRELGAVLELVTPGEWDAARIESELRKFAIERTLESEVVMNVAHAALTGQSACGDADAVAAFLEAGRQRSLRALRNA